MRTKEEITTEKAKVKKAREAALKKAVRCQVRLSELDKELKEAE